MLEPTDLLGEWRFDRRIDDRHADRVHVVRGSATLERKGDEVQWSEQGVLDGTTPVSRTLRVTREADGWVVRFSDGRPFHPWRFDVAVVHDCAPDVYRGLLSGSTSGWQVVWEATGPEKDYRMVSRLTRPGAQGRADARMPR